MARGSVRTNVGEPGQGSWVDQAGSDDGAAHVVEQRPAGGQWRHHDTLTVSSTAIPLDHGNHGHSVVTIEVQNAAIRYTLVGGSPTSSTGRQGLVNDLITLENTKEIAGFRAIRRDASDSTLDVTYGSQVVA